MAIFLRNTVFFICILSITGQTQSLRETIDNINPFSEKYTSFLDQDLNRLRQDASRAYQEQDYVLAAKLYLYILNYDYNDSTSLYNLACCYGLLERPVLASEFLARAISAGFTDYEHILNDGDFDKVRGKHEFDQIEMEIVKRKAKLGDVIYIPGKKVIKCRIKLPSNYNPDNKYPLIIGLHGYGSNCENIIVLGSYMRKPEIIFAVPEAPYNSPGNPYMPQPGYSWEIRTKDKKIWRNADQLSVDYIQNVAQELKSTYNVSQTYLMGFSQGVAYTYYTAFQNPTMFDGIICCAGIFPEPDLSFSLLSEQEIENASDLPVFIAHGDQDRAIDVEKSIHALEILEEEGYRVEFFKFAGGHILPAEVPHKALEWFQKLK